MPDDWNAYIHADELAEAIHEREFIAEMHTPCRFVKPEWACDNWGNYEHDWLDCPDCIEAYEIQLHKDFDDHPEPEPPEVQSEEESIAIEQDLDTREPL